MKRHDCSVAGKEGHICDGPIVFAHVRTETDGGTGLKPSDWWGLSLCDGAHREQHQIGEPAFEKKYSIRMKRLAKEFAQASTDKAMKRAMTEAGQ